MWGLWHLLNKILLFWNQNTSQCMKHNYINIKHSMCYHHKISPFSNLTLLGTTYISFISCLHFLTIFCMQLALHKSLLNVYVSKWMRSEPRACHCTFYSFFSNVFHYYLYFTVPNSHFVHDSSCNHLYSSLKDRSVVSSIYLNNLLMTSRD